MKKQLFMMGIILIILGIVFIPIAILTPMARTYPTESYETVVDYDGTPVPYPVEANLQSGNKYSMRIYVTGGLGISSYNPRIEIKDPSGVTVLLTTESKTDLTFNAQSTGVYTIWVSGYYKGTNERFDVLTVSKVIEKTITYYDVSPFSYVAILLIIAGIGISISSRVFFR